MEKESNTTEDLLSTRRMLFGGAPGEENASDRRELAARFQDASAVREALERARGLGAKRMASTGDPRLFAALGSRRSPALPNIFPVVPNIQGFMREAVERGIIGAGWARVRRMGLAPLAGLGLRGATRAPALLRRDFSTMLLCFIEMELADFRRYDPERVFLQPQIGDLALAMDQPRILEVYVGAVRRLTAARGGFMTHNFGTLVERCEKWGIEIGPVIAPWEASGGGMRPDRGSCDIAFEKLRSGGIELWADRSGWTAPPSEADSRALRQAGLQGVLRDDDEWIGKPRSAPPRQEAVLA